MNPGAVDIQFEMPIMIPAYLGAISNGLTMKPVNDRPKKATATHMKLTVISDLSGKPASIMKTADPIIPGNKKQTTQNTEVLY